MQVGFCLQYTFLYRATLLNPKTGFIDTLTCARNRQHTLLLHPSISQKQEKLQDNDTNTNTNLMQVTELRSHHYQFSCVSGDRGISDGFKSFTSNDSYELFSRNSSTRASIGMACSDSIVPLLGTSGSVFSGVDPLGS